jgi:hypothetical protein
MMTVDCPQAGALLDAAMIEHGPRGLLRRFFIWADLAAKQRGVSISFAPLAELADVNRANAATWRPLLPLFSPELSEITPGTGFALLGRNGNGEVVAAQAARLYDWSTTSLYDEATSLRMFYRDVGAARDRGDMCELATPAAHVISGRVVFSGGGWYRPDFRGTGLGHVIPRISRAYAFTRWASDFTISVMAAAVVAGGFAERAGYTNVAAGALCMHISPVGAVPGGALVWMESAQLLADLDAISGSRRLSDRK